MVSAIVLAAGSGSRMGSEIPKQYMPLCNRPLIFYALNEFEKSDVDEIIMVVAAGDIEYCRENIVDKYGFKKVSSIIEGGAERYLSVYEGLKRVKGDYVLIHDGARAFVDQDIIKRCIESAIRDEASVVGMPVKDTIKIADENGFAKTTPDRKLVWSVQTPQNFSTELVLNAYRELIEKGVSSVTDDAMVVELMTNHKVKLIYGSYENVKVTTPEDILIGENILKNRGF